MGEKMRFEGLTLTVESVERAVAFYSGKLGLKVEVNAAPAFAMIRHVWFWPRLPCANSQA